MGVLLYSREGNLPEGLPDIIGRGELCVRIARALGESRWVSVCGGGGVGKTRLAIQVARWSAADYPDGVWLVDLSSLVDPTLLVSTLTSALDLADVSAREERVVLAEALRDKRLLLILDTCEHMLVPVRNLAAELLDVAPRVQIITTSRIPLEHPWERIIQVPPMSTRASASAAGLPGSEAAQLFAARAQRAAPGFELGPDTLSQVTTLCQRLDGIPLALELAAGQLRHLSLEQLIARANVLDGIASAYDVDRERHQTLHAAMGWSHELLEPAERLLWARLSVFAGNFDLDAVQAVCASSELPASRIADALDSLVHKSIVVRQEGDRSVRFRLLDTLREYGAMWLSELDEKALLQRRHRDYYLGLAQRGEGAWSGSEQIPWFVRMRQALPNLRAALDWSLRQTQDTDHGLRLASSLWFLWVACGFSAEGRHWLHRALDASPQPSKARCQALWVEAYLANAQGDLSSATAAAHRCRTEAVKVGDPEALAVATKMLGTAAFLGGDLESAATYLGQALEYLSADPKHLNPGLLPAVVELGLVVTMKGEPQRALPVLAECVTRCRAVGETWLRSYAHYVQALAHRALGHVPETIAALQTALRMKRHFRDVLGIVLCLEALSQVVVDAGWSPRMAAVLHGAADVNWRAYGLPMMGSPAFADAHARCAEEVTRLIGTAAYHEAWAQGAQMSLRAAVDYAVGDTADSAIIGADMLEAGAR
ncbi:ATP-binding protein [Nonomuraea sp. KM90]|uniref:ATP-binding protein n=1 Tax=Nonomuraea sp. KM90 TaxID=3457428 RepID=UPI003FCE7BA0